jgi:hypothetical protein
MSQYIPQHPLAHAPIVSRRVATLLALFAVVAALAVTAVLVWGGSDSPTAAKSPATEQVSGPNETLRGQAAAGSAGAQQHVPGGPNETLRGQAIQP